MEDAHSYWHLLYLHKPGTDFLREYDGLQILKKEIIPLQQKIPS